MPKQPDIKMIWSTPPKGPKDKIPSFYYVEVEGKDGVRYYIRDELSLNNVFQYWANNGCPKVISAGSLGI